MYSEIESLNQLQTLEKKIEEINKNKDNLENELNEFRNDLNIIVENIQNIYKTILTHNDIKAEKKHHANKITVDQLQQLNNEKNDIYESNKLNKIALAHLEKLKDEFDILIINFNEKKKSIAT